MEEQKAAVQQAFDLLESLTQSFEETGSLPVGAEIIDEIYNAMDTLMVTFDLAEPDNTEEYDDNDSRPYGDELDGDAATALASAGWGTDEDYE